MKRIAIFVLSLGLLGVLGVSGPRHVAAAETHSNCLIFDPNGNVIGVTPSCSQTISTDGGAPFSFPGVNPCTGDTGTVEFAISHQVFHINVNAAGDAWDSGTANGVDAFAPDNAGAPSGQGPWTSWFGDSFNKQNYVQHFTISFHLRMSNGQTVTFHETEHISFTPNGPSVSFDKPTSACH